MGKPNILIFMTDQQRGDTVLPGSPAQMPNVEAFREEGVLFSEAHCPSPHCCPSRATFFTGLQPSEHNVWHNVDVSNAISRGLAEEVVTWSEDLKAGGYRLYFTGKWHVSAVESPANRGWEPAGDSFPERSGHRFDWWKMYSNLNERPDGYLRREGEIIRPGYPDYIHYGIHENPFGDLDVVRAAQKRIEELSDTADPWVLYAGTLGPHDPYFVPQRFLDRYPLEQIELPVNFRDDFTHRPNLYDRTRRMFDQLSEEEHRQAIRHYLAFCSYEDWLFGELLTSLRESGQADNTLVIYLSDHGDYMGEHGLWCKGLPCFKGAYHIPCIMRWPAGISQPGRSVENFIGLDDFAPTFLELAGIETDRRFSGRSLVPFLKNEDPGGWRNAYYTQSNGNELYGIQRSVTTTHFKLVYNGFDFDELYDLRDDPDEMNNVIDRPVNAPVVKELYRKLWTFAKENDDNCINPYIMVGLAEYGPALGANQ
jgi:arylsulfatase A-like enzyme